MKRAVLSAIAAGCLGILLGAATPKTVKSWHSRDIPTGAVVVALYDWHGETVPMLAVQTDYAGLYEYSETGRAVRPLDNPICWTYVPGGDDGL